MKTLGVVVMCVAMTGCAGMGRLCDETRLDAVASHTSHPFAGRPFGEPEEEDALNTIGAVGRCTVGRGYVDLGLGRKIGGDTGFYGPGLTGTVNVGVTLWRSQ